MRNETIRGELQRIQRERIKRKIIAMREMNCTTEEIAASLGLTYDATQQRIRRYGLADKTLSERSKGYIAKFRAKNGYSPLDRSGSTRRPGRPNGGKEALPRASSNGPCVIDGCGKRGYGRRQMCDHHRWQDIDQSLVEVRRRDLLAGFRVTADDAWTRTSWAFDSAPGFP